MKRTIKSTILIISFVCSQQFLFAQNIEAIKEAVNLSFKEATIKNSVSFDSELSDSITDLYTNIIWKLNSNNNYADKAEFFSQKENMDKIFNAFTKDVAKGKKELPNIAYKLAKDKQMREELNIDQEFNFDVKVISKYSRVYFQLTNINESALVFHDKKLKGTIKTNKNGLIVPWNRVCLIEIMEGDRLICSKEIELKKGEEYFIECKQ